MGLAVKVHRWRSKFIVDTLHEMGFCCSYTEVMRFFKNAADCVEPVLGGDVHLLEMSVLSSADEVNHNRITLDGKETIHKIGVIASVIPERQMNHIIPQKKQISELKSDKKTKILILE